MLHFKSGLNLDHNIVALGEIRILDKLEFSPVNGHREIRHQLTDGCIKFEPLCSFSTVLETTGFSELAFMSKNGFASPHSLRN